MLFKTLPALISAVLLTACLPQDPEIAAARLANGLNECPRDVEGQCFFVNSPVKLLQEPIRLPGRSNTFFHIAQTMEFVDGAARKWVAPRRTLTDGASIPQIFVPIVGSPTSPEFVNAAAVHDAYCGVGNEDGPVYHSKTWQETHRVFYDTLIVGGTPAPKAKLMFAAVWLGGPRWYFPRGSPDLTLEHLPKSLRLNSMRETRDYIDRSEPTLAQLLAFLKRQERLMLAYHQRGYRAQGTNVPSTAPDLGGGYPTDGY